MPRLIARDPSTDSYCDAGLANQTYRDCANDSYSEHGHSPLARCPKCKARSIDPVLGYCRLCEYEMHVWGEVAALEAAGDPEGWCGHEGRRWHREHHHL